MASSYKLTKTPAKRGEFLYEIKDETGTVINTRTSKREYVAATLDGRFFFGRLDLIGKGDHGRFLKHHPEEADNIATL